MEFDIVEQLLGMTLLGTEWVLWLLLGSSILSVAVMIERFVFFRKLKLNFGEFSKELTDHLNDGDHEAAVRLCEKSDAVESQIALVGLRNRSKGAKAMEGSMESLIVGVRHTLDRGLVVLGTLGNNAPFIGLFGTVLGIIQAFNDLALNPKGGPSVVMAGISEALVATAVGLLVAIPAVIAYNLFGRVVKRHISNGQAVIKTIMSYEQSEPVAKPNT